MVFSENLLVPSANEGEFEGSIYDEDILQMNDLIAGYPDQSDVNFQRIIFNKKEFNELESGPKESLPVNGLYKHQELRKRLLGPMNEAFVIDAAGTGKTCSIVSYGEEERKKYKEAIKNGDVPKYKRMIIIAQSPNLVAEMKKQIACRCTQGQFDKPGSSKGKKNIESSITKKLSKWYIIKKPIEFVNSIKNRTDSEIIEMYSDTIFWIDEVHRMRISSTSYDVDKKRRKEITYTLMWKILHICNNVKRIVTSATPQIQLNQELVYGFNLILPAVIPGDMKINMNTNPADLSMLAGQMPHDFFDVPREKEDYEPYFNGRILYARELDTGINLIYKTNDDYSESLSKSDKAKIEKLEQDYTSSLYKLKMSDFQAKVYKRSLNYSSTTHNNEVAASNFVFKDDRYKDGGNWGQITTDEERARKKEVKAYLKQLKEERKKKGIQTPVAQRVKEDKETGDSKKRADLLELEKANKKKSNLSTYEKYVTVIDDMFKMTDEFKLRYKGKTKEKTLENITESGVIYGEICRIMERKYGEPGNIFGYSKHLNGSGLITLCLCLELLGYERFDESSSPLESIKRETSGYCDSPAEKKLNPNFVKKKRYALLTGHTSSKRVEIIKEIFNMEENANGEYIAGIFTTEVGRDGINLFHVTENINIDPDWTPGANHQAMRRGVRATSHDFLIKLEKRRLQKEGKSKEEIDNFRLPVFIYQMASVTDDLSSLENYSIDAKIYYEFSEKKDREFKPVIRMMKEYAVDGPILRKRNQRTTDIDYSDICDYEKCAYNYINFPDGDYTVKNMDYTTYDVYYNDDLIDMCTAFIIEILHEKSILTMDYLIQEYDNVREFYAKLIKKKVNIESLESELLKDFGDFSLNKGSPEKGSDRITLPMLQKFINESRIKFLTLALKKIIYTKIQITDIFGNICNLFEDKQVFYLSKDIITPSIRDYNQSFVGISRNKLGSIKITKNINLDPIIESKNVDEIMKLPISVQVDILEYILLKIAEATVERDETKDALKSKDIENQRIPVIGSSPVGILTPKEEQIRNAYYTQGKYFVTHEPISEIEERLRPKPGRPPKRIEGDYKIKNVLNIDNYEKNFIKDKSTEIVYVHLLYVTVPDVDYGKIKHLIKLEGRYRLLKPSEGNWKDMKRIEYEVYNDIAQAIHYERKGKNYKDRPAYAYYTDAAKTKINLVVASLDVGVSAKEKSPGRALTTIDPLNVIEAFYQINLYNESNPDLPQIPLAPERVSRRGKTQNVKKVSKDEKLDYIFDTIDNRNPEEVRKMQNLYTNEDSEEYVNNWPDDQIDFFYSWMKYLILPDGGLSIPGKQFVELVKGYLIDTDSIVDV